MCEGERPTAVVFVAILKRTGFSLRESARGFSLPRCSFLFCSFFPPCTALKSNAFEVEQIAAYRVSTECVAGAQTRVNTKEAPATTTRHSTAK